MIDVANYSATETLRDGRTVEIRAQRPEDREGMESGDCAIQRGIASPSLLRGQTRVFEKETDYFLDIDFVNHVALVAVANEDGQPDDCRRRAVCSSSSPVKPKSRSRSSTHIRDWDRLSIDAPSRNYRP